MREHVALVGFMGAGKTSVGRRLALRVGLPFVDTDELVIEAHGPIAALFASEGEAGFRARELEAVRAALAGPPAILALGGGAVTHSPTRDLLAERALRVFLDVPFDIIYARVKGGAVVRPLLGAEPDPAFMRDLLAARLPLYRESDVIVACERRSSAAVADELATLLRARGVVPVA